MRDAMIEIFKKFCAENELPHISADELIMDEDLTDFQFGFLICYCRAWDAMEDLQND